MYTGGLNTPFWLCALLLVIFSQLQHSRLYSTECNVNSENSPPPYSTLYAEQQLDHFNYLEHRKWKQKYLISDVYWQDQGPLFFYTGNEAPIQNYFNSAGFIFTLALQFNALVVFAEHRYYGDSCPFGNNSLDFSYLSVEQALADFAVLIQHIKLQYPGISKVITFGGSYGGELSAWLRMKYPNVVDGALASSAPVAYTTGAVSRTALLKKVTEEFAAADPECPVHVQAGFTMMEQLAAQGEKGLFELTQYFNVCEPLKQEQIHSSIHVWVTESFTSLAKGNLPYSTAKLPAFPVKTACQIMASARNPALGIAQAVGLLYAYRNPYCINLTCEAVACEDGGACMTGLIAGISWDYQTCTEIMLPADSNNETDMFPPRVYDPTDCCRRTYNVSARRDWMKTQYGGMDFKSASNIIFSNGGLDPWSVGGVTLDTPVPDSIAKIFINEGAHHSDLSFPHVCDHPSVSAAREVEEGIIQQWLLKT